MAELDPKDDNVAEDTPPWKRPEIEEEVVVIEEDTPPWKRPPGNGNDNE